MGTWRLSQYFAWIVWLGLYFGASQALASNLPDLPHYAQAILSDRQEKLIGSAIVRQLRATPQFLVDPITDQYIGSLGQRLAVQTHPHTGHYAFFMIQDPSVNAFTFYGQNVVIHTGLINLVDSEGELAAVMAHEIAHGHKRHLARMMAQNKKLLPVTLLELLGAAAIGAAHPQAGMHLMAAALGAHMQQMINYTRDHEKEADQLGIELLANAGFDPYAMPNAFLRMQKMAQFERRPFDYLSTHPVYEQRIAVSMGRAKRYVYRQTPDSLAFLLIKERLKVLHHNDIKALLSGYQAQEKHQRYTNKTAFYYGYALALSQDRQYAKASKTMMRALPTHSGDLIVELGMAELEVQSNNPQAALKRLKHLADTHPNDLAVSLQLVQILLDFKQAKEAYPIVQALEKKYPQQLPVYKLLARTEDQLGKPWAMHDALAQWFALQGDFDQAQRQLKYGLEQIGNKASAVKQLKERQKVLQAIQEREKEALSSS